MRPSEISQAIQPMMFLCEIFCAIETSMSWTTNIYLKYTMDIFHFDFK